jgi:alpha-glucosidase
MNLLRLLAAFLLTASAPAAAQTTQVTTGAFARLPNGFETGTAPEKMRVTAVTDTIIRVRVAQGGRFPEDASWAVPAAVRHEAVPVQPTADDSAPQPWLCISI